MWQKHRSCFHWIFSKFWLIFSYQKSIFGKCGSLLYSTPERLTLWCRRKQSSLWRPVWIVIKGLLIIVIVTVRMVVTPRCLVLLVTVGVPVESTYIRTQIHSIFEINLFKKDLIFMRFSINYHKESFVVGFTYHPTACCHLHKTPLRCSTPLSSDPHRTPLHAVLLAVFCRCRVTCEKVRGRLVCD